MLRTFIPESLVFPSWLEMKNTRWRSSASGTIIITCSDSNSENAKPSSEDTLGLYHAAFKIGDKLHELKAAKEHVEAGGIKVLARDHVVTKSLYFEDPDGNPLELYIEGSDEWKRNPDVIAREGVDLDF